MDRFKLKYRISATDIVRLFGLRGVTFFPSCGPHASSSDSPSFVRFLHEVGLPHDDYFLSQNIVTDDGYGMATIGEAMARQGEECPPVTEKWLILAYFLDSYIAVDPVGGVIYAFPEGTNEYFPVHSDIESLVYCICALQEFHIARESVEGKPEKRVLAEKMREKIERSDELPFVDPLSEWNIIYAEILEGTW